MSYPSIGDAAAIESLLRDGHRIFLEDDCSPCGGTGGDLVIAQFKRGKFKLTGGFDFNRDEVIYESESFPDFAAWVAFGGGNFEV